MPTESQVYAWTTQLVTALTENYGLQGYTGKAPTFSITVGKKYYKVIGDQGGVNAFVEKKTGHVYKPASWARPAQHVRYDLSDRMSRESCYHRANFTGGYLYIR